MGEQVIAGPAGPTTSRSIPIRFAGEGSGEAPLTWSQADHWQANLAAGHAATFGGSFEWRGRITVESMAETLRFMMSRHQALRTRLRFDADGWPRQYCVTEGVIELQVIDAGSADPAVLATAVERDFHHREFDFEHEWPLRMALITARGEVTHQVVVYLHLAVDGGGIEALQADLAARDPETGEPAGPVTALQPLELAGKQATPAAQRQSAAAMRHWERVLRGVPTKLLGEPRRDGPASYRAIRYHSPAAAAAVGRIVTDLGVPGSSVIAAMYAVGLARYLRAGNIWTMMLVSNRFRPGLADTVGLVVQSSPFQLDVAGQSLATAAAQARASMLHTYKNAYYAGRHRDELMARMTRERGEPIDAGCYFNDRRAERPPTQVAPASDEQLRAALDRASWSEQAGAVPPSVTLFVNVEDALSTADGRSADDLSTADGRSADDRSADEPEGAIEFPISYDTRYFELADVLEIARNIEQAAVQTAINPNAPTGI